MISKELKKLNRRELVDVIYQLKKNEELLQARIAELEAELQERRIRLSEAGSIAQAAGEITGLFSAAQATADLYLREIAAMKEQTRLACAQMLEEAEKKAAAADSDGEAQLRCQTADPEGSVKDGQAGDQ